MTNYRKKPVVIEAVQWDGTYLHAKQLEAELGLNCLGMTAHPPSNRVSWWKIATLEDGHVVSPMDWIITGVKGEHHPCKPDIFELTYEAVITQPGQGSQALEALQAEILRLNEMTISTEDYTDALNERDAALARLSEIDAQPAPERNFCERCGQRLGGADEVHACTPPECKASIFIKSQKP